MILRIKIDGFIKTATEIDKVDIGFATEARNENVDGVLDAATHLLPDNVKADDVPKINDSFADLFENKILTRDDENLLNHLLTEIADAAAPHVVPEMKYVPIKTEEIKPKF